MVMFVKDIQTSCNDVCNDNNPEYITIHEKSVFREQVLEYSQKTTVDFFLLTIVTHPSSLE